MSQSKLFDSYRLGKIPLSNRMVMSPMTRNRATDNVPGELLATYYRQRSTAGLIVTEGTSPSPNGLGYPRIPGAFSEEQREGWRKTSGAVHEAGGRIFMQLMHTGRVSHPANLPAGAEVLGPSAVALDEKMYTDSGGMQPLPVPREMTKVDIDRAVGEYAQASKLAVDAGFDGVELHGANGYLIDQFLNTASNQRTDEYGGSIQNRGRFTLEVARAAAGAIGAERVGIRLSPYGVFNGMALFPEIEEQYAWLATELDRIGLAYVHLVNHSSMGAPEVKASTVKKIRDAYRGTLILSGGYDRARAEKDLESGAADLVAFGRPFLANPDLVERFRVGAALNEPDMATFYTPGEKGYTDYPVLTAVRS